VLGLVRNHDVGAAGEAELDMDHRRNGAAAVAGPLVDTDAARYEPTADFLQVRDPFANFGFGPAGAFGVVKSDFEGHLHTFLRTFPTFGAFPRLS
jgi:hypothetical protein